MAAGQHRDQDLIDDVALAKDDSSNRLTHLSQARDGFLHFADDGVRAFKGLHGGDYSLSDGLDRTGLVPILTNLTCC